MQKVILDTNVFVSSFLTIGYPQQIVDAFLQDRFILCVSDSVIKEYYEVFNRPKFSDYPDFAFRAARTLRHMESQAVFFVTDKIPSVSPDEDDNIFIALAETSQADFLVTGNIRDFGMSRVGQKSSARKIFLSSFFNSASVFRTSVDLWN